MRKLKHYFAFALAAVLSITSIPMSAFAANGTSGTGDSTVEVNNAQVSGLARVVLPTIKEDTYDFTIDTESLLGSFDSDSYAADQSVYFLAENTVNPSTATLTDKDTSDTTTYKFYTRGLAVTSSDDIATALAGKDQANIGTEIGNSEYYIWKPVSLTTNEGEFVKLTADNWSTYITYTADSGNTGTTVTANDAFDPAVESGIALSDTDIANIWDGNIYLATYTAVTGADADAIAKAAAAAYETDASSLYVGATDSSTTTTTYTHVNKTDAQKVGITYTAASTYYNSTSAKATIINKSTSDIAITVKVNVTNADGLTFVADASQDFDNTATNLYLAVKDSSASGTEAVAIKTNSTGTTSASVYYVLKGSDLDTLHSTYQITGGEVDPITGSANKYYQYKTPTTKNSSYKSASFSLTGEADVDAEDAWAAYVEGLKDGTYTKPSIDVVYTIEEVALDTGTSSPTKDKYLADNGGIYAASGWTTYDGSKVPGFDTTANTALTFTTASDLTVTMTTVSTVKAIAYVFDTGIPVNTIYTGAIDPNNILVDTTDYSVASNVITFKKDSGALFNTANAITSDMTATLLVQLDDDTIYAIPITIEAAGTTNP